MTAEVIILNRNGVALAADSAVTISGAGASKVYNSVNKLFALSRHAPVGAMVYGNSELSSVPWETVIKVYRHHLGARKFPKLTDYGQDLIAFLNKRNDLFPPAQQRAQLLGSFTGYCRNQILRDIDQEIGRRLALGRISLPQIRIIARDTVAAHLTGWDSLHYLPGRTVSYVTRVTTQWAKDIDTVIQAVFQKTPLSAPTRARIRRLAGLLFAKQRFPEDGISGLVIAGFGEREHFPSFVRFSLEGVVLDRLKYREDDQQTVGPTHGTSATIVPLAQREMVDLFMMGMDPSLLQMVTYGLETVMRSLPSLVVDPLRLSAPQKDAVRRQLDKVAAGIPQSFQNTLESVARDVFADPILERVSSLPKEELALMAEALVNLTAFKRRIAAEVETVGGPIDVAVISKGDGLIWIKRKHYFESSLNPQFIAGYSGAS